ncbi:MAG: CARDB domain-containing protein [Dehalococcoidales bacterium]|jgi:hypothetical protein
MKIKAFISVSLLLLLLVCAVPAYAIPALPHAFYGTVTINGSPAPAGTQVRAIGTGVMTGVPQNPLVTTTAGQYGNSGVYLLVQGDIPDGATITFYVAGVPTVQTATWHSGETTQLNLSATISQGGGGGGGGAGASQLNTNLFGTTGVYTINSDGIIQEQFQATSTDGKLTVTVPIGTTALDISGNPLTAMTAVVMTNPPAPPENANIIGLAYSFGPAGATFNPPITFTWTYDPATLPDGVDEASLDIAYYDTSTGSWVTLHGVVNTTNHTITAQVSHFSTFAIIGYMKPAAFSLSSLAISPAQVSPGDNVDINLTVANTGGLGGSYTVVLNINGAQEAEKSVTINGGSSQTVSFSVTKTDPGTYNVGVGGLTGSFTVAEPPPTTTQAATTPPVVIQPTTTPPASSQPAITPPATTAPSAKGSKINWAMVGGIAGGVIIVILVIILFTRRRD